MIKDHKSFKVIHVHMWLDLQKGVLYMNPILQLWNGVTPCVVEQLTSNLVTVLSYHVKFNPQNFEAIA